ncbi:hypothetical protein ACPYO6_02245 [Georgenia sp. Z1344]|uniref:hypothetical protein n=1 Tax=Georgenia sp. Z1344 TaxID=3416706 RepID=UPI003CF8CFEB
MSRTPRRSLATACAGILLAATAAACGSDDSDDGATADGAAEGEAPCRVATGESSSGSASESGSESGSDEGARPAVVAAEALCDIPGIAAVAPDSSAGPDSTQMIVAMSGFGVDPVLASLETWHAHDDVGEGSILVLTSDDPAAQVYVSGFPEPLGRATVERLVELAGAADGVVADIVEDRGSVATQLRVEPGADWHGDLLEVLPPTAALDAEVDPEGEDAGGNVLVRYPDEIAVLVPTTLDGAMDDPAWAEVVDQTHAVEAALVDAGAEVGSGCRFDASPAGTPAVTCRWFDEPEGQLRTELDTLADLVESAGGSYVEDPI